MESSSASNEQMGAKFVPIMDVKQPRGIIYTKHCFVISLSLAPAEALLYPGMSIPESLQRPAVL